MIWTKETRQKTLSEIIRSQKVATQEQLLAAMQALGVKTTQASLSRDISELGVVKEEGCYAMHPASFFQGGALQVLSLHAAGPNMLVVKTASGMASLVADGIDEAKIEGVVGTLAGENTVFVALFNARKSSKIKKEIIHRFRPVKSH